MDSKIIFSPEGEIRIRSQGRLRVGKIGFPSGSAQRAEVRSARRNSSISRLRGSQ